MDWFVVLAWTGFCWLWPSDWHVSERLASLVQDVVSAKVRNIYMYIYLQARSEDYAFFWDSAVLDYVVEQKPCNTLQSVGRLFAKIGYGFGLQKNSPFKNELSVHILQLRESGYIDELKVKWYVFYSILI